VRKQYIRGGLVRCLAWRVFDTVEPMTVNTEARGGFTLLFLRVSFKTQEFKGILGREGVEHRLSGVDKVAGDLIQGDLSEGDVSIDERVEKRIP